jgi:diguanylate cyclase (GGDEF)-like protein
MGLAAVTFIVLYLFPLQRENAAFFVILAILFPLQCLLWRLSSSRKAKDFFFCLSLLLMNLFLKEYWDYSDLIFYVTSILMAAVLAYRIFIAVAASGIALELLHQFRFGTDNPQEIAFRYLLFVAAGSLTYFLIGEERKKKEEFKKELDDLKYGIHQVEPDEPVSMMSERGQISRKVDASMALDESLNGILQLIHSIVRPTSTLLWQYLPENKQLRVQNSATSSDELKDKQLVELGQGPVGWAALNRQMFFQQDREEGIPFPIYKKQSAIRSLIAIPIQDGERLEGVLSLDSDQLTHFGEGAAKSISSFAEKIAETIRNARFAQDREGRVVEFQTFYHASKDLSSMIDSDEIMQKLHELCIEIAQPDFMVAALSQEEEQKYSLYTWEPDAKEPQVQSGFPNDGRAWISWFLRNREEPLILSLSQIQLQEMPLLSANEDLHGAESFLAVPMRHQQNCIGALLLGSKKPDAFNSYNSRVLFILCNQAAVVLENSTMMTRMEQLAITDGMTGLFNHRHFQESLEREIERADRAKQPLTLLLLDIDHFKKINDTFGHPAGDFILKSMAGLIKDTARKIDILARYGGEEFAALLPGIDLKNARKTADRWRKKIQSTTFRREKQSFSITVSIGFALFPNDAGNKKDLIEKADRALYLAKETGRNQVRHCRDDEAQSSRLFG